LPKPEALAHDEAVPLNLGKVREDLRHDWLGAERWIQLD